MNNRLRFQVPDWVRLASWSMLGLLGLAALGNGFSAATPYGVASAVLAAGAVVLIFLPLGLGHEMGTWSITWVTGLGLLTVANRVESALSAPAWWYAAVLLVAVIGASIAIKRPARFTVVAAMLGLAAAAAVSSEFARFDSSVMNRITLALALQFALYGLALMVRLRRQGHYPFGPELASES